MQYFFILGRNPTLSLAELHAVLGNITVTQKSNEWIIVESKESLDIPTLVSHMGGVVKAGEIIQEENFIEILKSVAQNNKTHFGFSFYSKPKDLIPKNFALSLKKQLKEEGISSRWVESKEQVLSSIIVQKNHLLGAGAEFVFLKDGIGRTLAVPDVEAFGEREFGKPQRSINEGMLPVQLARVMINLAQVKPDAVILDPFCGSGTVLMEALAMGHTKVIGTDISEDAVARAKENVAWLPSVIPAKAGIQINPPNIKILPCNVRKLSTTNITVDAVITEPSLGPLQLPFHSKTQMNVIVRDLANLYLAAFTEFAKILRPHGKVVFIFPAFQGKLEALKTSEHVVPHLAALGFTLVPLLPSSFATNYQLPTTNSLTYQRPGQTVLREIMVFERQ